MKHIIIIAALAAMTTQINAATASDLIREKNSRHRIHNNHDRHATETTRHYAPTKRWVKHQEKPKVKAVNRQAKVNHHKHAIKRSFRTLNQYRRTRHATHPTHQRPTKHFVSNHGKHAGKKMGRYVGNGWFEDEHGQYDEQYQNDNGYLWIPSKTRHQHGYHYYRRQWYLTYLYEYAEFDDKHGYHYGYFDRRGFVFDGEYYRYDRAYTYQDRLHGKGLFEHRFYRPIHRRAHRRHTWREISGGNVRFEWQF